MEGEWLKEEKGKRVLNLLIFFKWTLYFDFYIRRFIYKFLNVCPFDYTAVAGSGKVGPVNQVNHTSWVAVVTPTDRPKSVRNRCLIELFCGVVCVFTLPFWHFRGCRGFCQRTESDLLLFVPIGNKHFRFYGSSMVYTMSLFKSIKI